MTTLRNWTDPSSSLSPSTDTLPQNKKEEAFEKGYLYATKYWQEEGHLYAREEMTYQGFKLGQWLRLRRDEHKRGKLVTSRVDRLNQIGMIWNVTEARFKIGLYFATRYAKEHGNCNAPISFVQNGFPLGIWLSNQRRTYRSSSMSQENMKALEGIGMIWSPRVSRSKEAKK
jgi:hypothetical protein